MWICGFFTAQWGQGTRQCLAFYCQLFQNTISSMPGLLLQLYKIGPHLASLLYCPPCCPPQCSLPEKLAASLLVLLALLPSTLPLGLGVSCVSLSSMVVLIPLVLGLGVSCVSLSSMVMISPGVEDLWRRAGLAWYGELH